MLSLCDSGAGFVVFPGLSGLILGNRSDVRILHDHARTGVPSQNSIVIPGYRGIHGLLIVIHCLSQCVICGGAGSSVTVSDARVPQTLPNDALVVSPLEIAFNLCKNLL